jgi:hypothetical protein
MRILKIIFLVLIIQISDSYGQLANRNIAWFLPSKGNRINGLAIGLYINRNDSINIHEQTINGIGTEIIGLGFKLPISSEHPFSLNEKKNETILDYADSLDFYNCNINGLNLSVTGTLHELSKINGINISGLFSYTGKVNGFTTSIFLNMARELRGFGLSYVASSYSKVKGLQLSGIFSEAREIHGVQISIVNKAITLKGIQIGDIYSEAIDLIGIQIGVVNKTEKLKGIQIGIWNVNNKRSLPIINFNFKN